MRLKVLKKSSIVLSAIMITSLVNMCNASALLDSYPEKIYTSVDDFNLGNYSNVITTTAGELKLDEKTNPYPYLWMASINKGSMYKIDTETGKILGEYLTSPDLQPKGPSRVTVDKNGSVWVANNNGNSVIRVCLPESGLWIDKNGNGVCDTSVGLGDVRAWANAGEADTEGGVTTAQDECIINYVKVSSTGTRHLSVDKNNDVWASGSGNKKFDLIDGVTGLIKRTEGSVGFGGYGGLIDSKGFLWSSGSLLRWDTTQPLTGRNGVNWYGYFRDSYFLGIDKTGNVWETALEGNAIRKYDPDGVLLGQYNHGYENAQGCVADLNGDIWVSHMYRGSNTVGHIKNNGQFVGNVTVPTGATGVAVDSKGYIWASCYDAQKAVRINPNLGAIGADGITHIGEVDLSTEDLGGKLYNYSDMTGSTLQGAPNMGYWSVTFDSNLNLAKWGVIDWNSIVEKNGEVIVSVASSDDGIKYSNITKLTNGSTAKVPNGRYLKVYVALKAASTGESPILKDITIRTNDVPHLEVIGNKTVNENQLLQFEVKSSDMDNKKLTFKMFNLPEGAGFNPENRIFYWKPTHNQIGNYPGIRFEVTDGKKSDYQEINIEVLKVYNPPDTSLAYPSVSSLWPLNHEFVDVKVFGVKDVDNNDAKIQILNITSDEPSNSISVDGMNFTPDAYGVGTDIAHLRAEKSAKGNGRVYRIYYLATGNHGEQAIGLVKVLVPERENGNAFDDGIIYDATT